MMRYAALIILAYSFVGCNATLDLSLLEEEGRTAFQVLDLESSYDLEKLRIDIIRQTQMVQDTDSTETEENVDYHTLGFDLGNGLFYDLNRNLSLIPARFMDLRDSYSISRILDNKKRTPNFTQYVDEEKICSNNIGILGKSREQCIDLKREQDQLAVYRNGQFCFQIIEKDDTLQLFNNRKRRYGTVIESADGQAFFKKTRKGRILERYEQDGETITLDTEYLLKRTNNGKRIDIYRQSFSKKAWLLYSIERTAHHLFIYSRYQTGFKISVHPNRLVVHRNRNTEYRVTQ